MKIIARSLFAAALAGISAPALAADLSTSAPAVLPPAAAAPILNTLSLEFSPEFDQVRGDSVQDNTLVDSYIKGGYSRSLPGGFSWGATFQYTAKTNSIYQLQPETTLGYTLKLDSTFSIPVSAGIGYVANENYSSQQKPENSFAYYVLNAGLNVKFDSHWTWNAIAARYRNAFVGNWITPKLTTGVTYTIDPHNAVYVNAGYSWQGSALKGAPTPDVTANKWNVALGYKYGF